MDFMDSQDIRAEEGKEQWKGEEMGVWGQGCDVTGGEEETGDSSSTAAQQHNLLKRLQSDLM